MANSTLIGLLLCVSAHQAVAGELDYLKTQGDSRQAMRWALSRQDGGWVVDASEGDSVYRNVCAADGATRAWQYTGPDTDVDARVVDGTLAIRGRRAGETVDGTYALAGLPWYQPLSFSLARFLQTPAREVTFWTIRPDTLRPVKMLAERKGVEALAWRGTTVRTDRVHVRPSGMLALLWEADYWFARDSGCFVRYASSGRFPGVADVRIELQSASADCTAPG